LVGLVLILARVHLMVQPQATLLVMLLIIPWMEKLLRENLLVILLMEEL
tara:strand:+ start:239 stop:385 length:147 start_codon:yes stop_codon:yes gene_type:complete